MSKESKGITAILLIIAVIIIDQVTKILVKTNMSLYESIEITNWFKIYFVENPGMAFGMQVGGKLFLTLFRLIAICLIGYYLYWLIEKGFSKGYILCIALIWAGAFGNIIDCVFYGEIFSASYPGHVASFVPIGNGYSEWLHGKVVDMLYFPLVNGTLPSWFPFWGGEDFIFFSPIFNVADSAITIGIFILIAFYRKTLNTSFDTKKS